MNIFFLIIYYIKCGINILLAKIFNLFRKVKEDKQIIKCTRKKLSDYLYLIKLEGTYLEMGNQYGELMKDILQIDTKKAINFLNENKSIFFKHMNPRVRKKINSDTTVMDACYLMYLEHLYFVPQFYLDFLKGVSESSEIDYKIIVSLNFFTELAENHCILYSDFSNNKTLSIRTLDFFSPLFTQSLIIFKPINEYSYINLNLSFLASGITMISENKLIIGESFCDNYLGKDEHRGIPFSILFHKVMKESKTYKEAENIIINAKRMGNLNISIVDAKNNSGNLYQYCSKYFKSIQFSNDSIIYNVTANERKRFENYKDSFKTAEEAIHNMLPMVKSGELHIMIYEKECIYISVTSEFVQSYNNDFVKIRLNDLFKDSSK